MQVTEAEMQLKREIAVLTEKLRWTKLQRDQYNARARSLWDFSQSQATKISELEDAYEGLQRDLKVSYQYRDKTVQRLMNQEQDNKSLRKRLKEAEERLVNRRKSLIIQVWDSR